MPLEVCVDSYTSLLTAVRAGADRIELCSTLNLGGLTPSYGLMKQAITIKNLEIFVMIRPRSGDFIYDDNEWETMIYDIEKVKEMGFSGIVTGVLHNNGKINIERMKEIVDISYPLKVVLHRAFDDALEPINDMEKLIDIGICRILTSGQKPNALEGSKYIAKLQKKYGDKITIMPCCGVNADNIPEIYKITGCTHYHLSGKVNVGSKMPYSSSISDLVIERADYMLIKKAKEVLDKVLGD
ncbi:MAG TPA: copper homeostasis protein CutC [Haloplasmataceae bacterium]